MRTLPWIRASDVVWILVFAALAWLAPHRDAPELEVLAGIVLVEIVGPRVAWLRAAPGIHVLIACKLLLAYLFIGLTGGISSSFYLILFLPILTAANVLSWWETGLTTMVAIFAYLSFAFLLDPERYVIASGEMRELAIRAGFLAMAAFIAMEQARLTRTNARQYQAVARDLEKANRDLKTAEAAVRRADRLAALGQLTAGLAHELRNPLGTIRASAEMLTSKLQNRDPVSAELTGYISSEVDRTNSLVSRFLDFARPLRPALARMDLNQVLDAAVSEYERLGIRNPVVKNFAPDLPALEGDAELLRAAALNLLTNAAQASAPEAAITLRTRKLDSAVEWSVIDCGHGIASKDLDAIFNPFFTTRSDGVGLGLPIVARIVDEHAGRIHVESEMGQGSVFRVILPVART